MKVIGKIWWIPFGIYILVITSFMSDRIDEVPCRKVMIGINDSVNHRFVTSESVMEIIDNGKWSVLGKPISQVETQAIENRISDESEIRKAEVYMTLDGTMHVDVEQRDPVMRVISKFGNSYYIDSQGYVFPYNTRYTPRLIVVTGNIEVPDECLATGTINSLDTSTTVNKVFGLVGLINNDDFWRGQIEQISVVENDEFELIPRVGNFVVKFGTNERREEKLRNLESLYREALPRVGWNKYSEVSLKYSGQIVCKKR